MPHEDHFDHSETWAMPPGYHPPQVKKNHVYDLSLLHNGFLEGEHTEYLPLDAKDEVCFDPESWFV